MKIEFGREVVARDFISALESAAKEFGGGLENRNSRIVGEQVIAFWGDSEEESKKVQDRNTTIEPVVWLPFTEQIGWAFKASKMKIIFFSTNKEDPTSYYLISKKALIRGKSYRDTNITVSLEGKTTPNAKKVRIGLLVIPVLGWLLAGIGEIWCQRNYHDKVDTPILEVLSKFFDTVREHLESSDKLSSASSSPKELGSAPPS